MRYSWHNIILAFQDWLISHLGNLNMLFCPHDAISIAIFKLGNVVPRIEHFSINDSCI